MKSWKVWRNSMISLLLVVAFLILEKKFATSEKIYNPLYAINLSS
jgi:hypothetical protein